VDGDLHLQQRLVDSSDEGCKYVMLVKAEVDVGRVSVHNESIVGRSIGEDDKEVGVVSPLHHRPY